ncbi:hypothetical protein DET1533 [Dehalococcoides mccartyi 195]|uniref:Uncharacterized protein n=1 Tax=Dehalococcoides mccartyi (strain ATCC BAA-2266 / KCTC 15142 / 195) TaxID=243164 RepID=Q3Z6B8_DEHM1|nr:hypothetical protein DET1533 [Dehalococcoides mccartyi 195]
MNWKRGTCSPAFYYAQGLLYLQEWANINKEHMPEIKRVYYPIKQAEE